MGVLIVDMVIEGLTEAGIRAKEAHPGERMPDFSAPAVAVGLQKVENGIYTVRAEVLSPAYLGGTICEEYAEDTRIAMEALGAICTQEGIGYDGRTGLFRIPIQGLFPVEKTTPAPDLTVKLGLVKLKCVEEFSASQETEDPEATPLSGCGWSFRIREFIPQGTVESGTPAQPFTVTVNRTGRQETFENCRLTSVRRTDTGNGLEQIRTGIAGSRSFAIIV